MQIHERKQKERKGKQQEGQLNNDMNNQKK